MLGNTDVHLQFQRNIRETTYLKGKSRVKHDDKTQKEPDPNIKADFGGSLHMTKSAGTNIT